MNEQDNFFDELLRSPQPGSSCTETACLRCGILTPVTPGENEVYCTPCNNENWLSKDVFGAGQRSDLRELHERLLSLDSHYRIRSLRRRWDGTEIEIAISSYVEAEADEAISAYKRRLSGESYY